ncbi:MAG TPA: MSMEG_1061 family FMN-dependent PPOX-type flavoprotein [Acidimicrobiales bacterium]|nr:MSMEG_1061 family FMN-dependent PPOX-type flavoprotein [Acidimicrobiales bacterium]
MNIFGNCVTSPEHLRSLYREPSNLVRNKKHPRINERSRAFFANATFCLLATTDADGRADVSPRGGPPGFVKVLDDRHLVIPDLSGNNLLDSLGNIAERASVGLLVLIPGLDETLRVNGQATLSIDPSILSLWQGQLRTPKVAIGIAIDEIFGHCAKAFRRGGVWDHASWIDPIASGVPDVCEAYAESLGGTISAGQLRSAMEENYAQELADEREVQRK